jgi:CheY-like chemotaxis protein
VPARDATFASDAGSGTCVEIARAKFQPGHGDSVRRGRAHDEPAHNWQQQGDRGYLPQFMIGAGAVLEMTAGMTPVRCAIADEFAANAARPKAQPQRKFAAVPENSPRRVLVVDDEPLIRWSVTESLADLGLDVEQASDAASALRIVTAAVMPFDVVVLDLRLPDMEDLSLLGTVRQLLPAASLILMTAFGTPEIITDAQAMGAVVINKPFELDELKQLICA